MKNNKLFLFLLLLIILSPFLSAVAMDSSMCYATRQVPAEVRFVRTAEPNENAFTFLKPVGWTVTGGITRVDPGAAGGAGNAIEAKLYMKLSSPDKKAELGWLPDTRFFDIQRCPTNNLIGGMYPYGSNYNGMLVWPLSAPEQFVAQVAVPFAHPAAQNVRITSVSPMPGLAERYRNLSAQMIPGYAFGYQVAVITLEYSENGIAYLEKMYCVIEDYGQLGNGLWGNKEMWYVRAEKGSFEKMSPVFATIGQSVKINTDWLVREIKSQQVNGQIVLQTQQDIARIEKEISEHRANTNSEINNDMYLNLTGQEDYVNPWTGETERGSNEWGYRWENDRGDVIYTDNQSYNPNQDSKLNVSGYRRSEIRKR
ncbi:MAG: hypothetical protein ACOYXB_04940 [Bacteroidota bacterium]